MEPPSKKPRKLLEDSESDSDSDSQGGVSVAPDAGFKINEEYARRFEYNKKREERQQLEAKLGKTSINSRNQGDGDEQSNDEEDSSDEEEEDEDGELATEALDTEIFATLDAIRSKDPRVYDKNAKFYSEVTESEAAADQEKRTEKPMYLRDYHRQNLLNGGVADETKDTPKTFAQEQADLKKSVLQEMQAAANDQSSDEEEDGDFLIAKPKPKDDEVAQKKVDIELDVENADKDPETFLSNFLSARAWIPTKTAQFQPFESDDEEEEKRAEALEEAYNFRFEDPNKLNEKLITHARDTANQFSVRREEMSSRKKKREAEREKKEAERRERENQKNRLRKLKMEELEEKVQKIKQAAGLKAADITEEEWARFLDDNWDDEKWEKEMAKRFGEDYYAEDDAELDGDEESTGKKKRKPKKPTWDDDIDIKDLVPDFQDEAVPPVSLTDDDEEAANEEEDDEESGRATKKSRTKEKHDQKRAARKEKRLIEQAVDRNLDLDPTLLPGATRKNASQFRYRETSPQSFGLTARDILMADDAQLNQFVGLKKLATFRDPERKRRDLKKMGKKARLRQWRKDTFGTEEEPEFVLPQAPAAAPEKNDDEMKVDIREGGSRKKRKRSKKH
ncbi:ribosome biogenesis protein Kri1 [Talaromyces stipitatus ATCC 10500]|uniref:Ribosome biogenesis protein Kri1 n=1 Tax=Talaromyces stipitatus (strain ATCC 10500 / CBS 375.48 / QM 6759 / NRRL 1006) TaxID=441959 RepID=B8M5Y8_TALSN|nr:ribosome biogenesis protein Kri1 [Talaromyces stipitatus ATCC 10500]EED20115.1 ribosome biogenesis protein Kri1 [Talaromyces stipitatus ATCC 10500]